MNDYIIAIILIPVYILLALLGRRFLTFAHGYEKGLEDAEKIRKIEEKRALDKIRTEIEQLPMTDTAIRLVDEILDKYKSESGDKE